MSSYDKYIPKKNTSQKPDKSEHNSRKMIAAILKTT